MLASELLEEVKNRVEKYGDEEIIICISKWFGDYERKSIISVYHKWEDWIFINI